MLLMFPVFEGSEFGTSFHGEVIRYRFRALTNVDKYVVPGPPDSAETMLEIMGPIIPVEAHTLDLKELQPRLGVTPSIAQA